MYKSDKTKVACIGIILCASYFIIVLTLIFTQLDVVLTIMEVLTIVSSIYMMSLLKTVYIECSEERKGMQQCAKLCAGGCILFSTTTHLVNMFLTRPTIRNGGIVPDYLQIGKWPSIEMAMDYIAWGLLLGMAFLFTAATLDKKICDKNYKILKYTITVCGLMCMVGTIGPIINVLELWYIAVLAYTVGTTVICVEQIVINK